MRLLVRWYFFLIFLVTSGGNYVSEIPVFLRVIEPIEKVIDALTSLKECKYNQVHYDPDSISYRKWVISTSNSHVDISN